MTLPRPIIPDQTDAKSPVDDNLMDSIREDLDYLNEQFETENPSFRWEVSGNLNAIAGGKIKRIAGGVLPPSSQFNVCKMALEKSGTSGNIEIDIRKHNPVCVAITSILAQFSDGIQSISNIAPSLSTQSIARAATPQSTQEINFVKAALNIQSIVPLGSNLFQLNFLTTPDDDYIAGASVLIASADNAANDGIFEIVERNRSGGNNIVISNASGVAQTGAAGTLTLQLLEYVFTNPADSEFTVGENATFNSHTDPENDGTFKIYKVNEGGNNVLVFNPDGLEQAGVAGTVAVNRWTYTFSSTPSATDFIVGEKIKASGHSNSDNDGSHFITSINDGGDNITVYNDDGAAQGGAAGSVDTNRWIYALSTDNSANVSTNEDVYFYGATAAANNGVFKVKQVNRLASNNIVVYNESGVAQAGVAGTVLHTNKVVAFGSDQSASITTDSIIEIVDSSDKNYNETDLTIGHQVLEINRGGGANFNAVINVQEGLEIPYPVGMVQVESKSIFKTLPSLAAETVGNREKRCIFKTHTDFVDETVAENTQLYLWINSIHEGDPQDLTVTLL